MQRTKLGHHTIVEGLWHLPVVSLAIYPIDHLVSFPLYPDQPSKVGDFHYQGHNLI